MDQIYLVSANGWKLAAIVMESVNVIIVLEVLIVMVRFPRSIGRLEGFPNIKTPVDNPPNDIYCFPRLRFVFPLERGP